MDTQKIEAAVKMIIEAVGEDTNREGLAGNTCSCGSYVPRDFFRSWSNSGGTFVKIF